LQHSTSEDLRGIGNAGLHFANHIYQAKKLSDFTVSIFSETAMSQCPCRAEKHSEVSFYVVWLEILGREVCTTHRETLQLKYTAHVECENKVIPAIAGRLEPSESDAQNT
jgi:hypothetical protein